MSADAAARLLQCWKCPNGYAGRDDPQFARYRELLQVDTVLTTVVNSSQSQVVPVVSYAARLALIQRMWPYSWVQYGKCAPSMNHGFE